MVLGLFFFVKQVIGLRPSPNALSKQEPNPFSNVESLYFGLFLDALTQP